MLLLLQQEEGGIKPLPRADVIGSTALSTIVIYFFRAADTGVAHSCIRRQECCPYFRCPQRCISYIKIPVLDVSIGFGSLYRCCTLQDTTFRMRVNIRV